MSDAIQQRFTITLEIQSGEAADMLVFSRQRYCDCDISEIAMQMGMLLRAAMADCANHNDHTPEEVSDAFELGLSK